MLKGLSELENKFPSLLNAARGRGTFCAIDCPSAQIRYVPTAYKYFLNLSFNYC